MPINQEYETCGVLEAGSVLRAVISPEFLSLRARVLSKLIIDVTNIRFS